MAEEEIFQPDSPRPDSRAPNQADTPGQTSGQVAPEEPAQHRWPLRRWATLLAVVLLVVLSAIYVWQTFFPSIAQRLQKGEADWRAGLIARRQRNWDQAVSRFDQALSATETVVTTLENAQNQRTLTEHEKRYLGQAYWLRARALFGKAAAQLEREAAEKQSSTPAGLPEADKEDVLELFMIADAGNRREALVSLYRASHYLPDNFLVLREVLKHRMNEPFEHWNWQHIRQLGETVASGNATDANLLARAYFVLALHGYHQPEPSGAGFRLPAPDKKQRPPMLESLQWLQKLESVEQPLRFRSVYLQAQIWQWLAENYRRQVPRDSAESEKYQRLLEQLLFDSATGLPGTLGQRAEKMLAELVSPMDIAGVFGLYRLALDNLTKTTSGADLEAQNRLRNLTESTARLVQQASSFPPHRGLHAWRALGEGATVVRRVQARLSASPDWWRQAGEQLSESAEKIATTFGDWVAVETCQELAHLAIQLAQADSPDQQVRRRWLQQAEIWAKRARQQLNKLGLNPQLKEQQEKLERRLHALRVNPR